MPAETRTPLDRAAVAFARLLRHAGLDVGIGSVETYMRALDAVGVDRPQAVYWAGLATLVNKHEDVAVYDAAFRTFWLREVRLGRLTTPGPQLTIAVVDDSGEADAGDSAAQPEGPTIAARYSAHEVLRNKDFAAFTHAEFEEARRLIHDLRLVGDLRRSRRLRPTTRRTGRPDVRRTVRRALKSGGEAVARSWMDTSQRPRRIVLLCDVSGSMDPYARALVRFLHAAVIGRARVEVFALGTRLTRITRELQSRDPDAAIRRAAEAVKDWSGGTRLGEGLREFNSLWGVRGMARGAVVVILSDGLDRGEPDVLAEQMVRLRRVAHKIVWVNPLKAAAGYAPLARGMAAALPYCDEFVEGHSIASLEALARVVGGGTA